MVYGMVETSFSSSLALQACKFVLGSPMLGFVTVSITSECGFGPMPTVETGKGSRDNASWVDLIDWRSLTPD